jgi:transketolase
MCLRMRENPQVVLIGTGSEVWPARRCCQAARGRRHSRARGELPSWKIFEEQTAEYKASVLPGRAQAGC